jgi:hypothetical protein
MLCNRPDRADAAVFAALKCTTAGRTCFVGDLTQSDINPMNENHKIVKSALPKPSQAKPSRVEPTRPFAALFIPAAP